MKGNGTGKQQQAPNIDPVGKEYRHRRERRDSGGAASHSTLRSLVDQYRLKAVFRARVRAVRHPLTVNDRMRKGYRLSAVLYRPLRGDYRPLAQKASVIPTLRAKISQEYRPFTQRTAAILTSDASFGSFLRRGVFKVRMLAGRMAPEMAATDAYPPSPTIPTPCANLAVIEKLGAPRYRPLTHVFVSRSREAADLCRADGHNTDPWHNEYRPRGQRIQTPRASEYRPLAQGNTDLPRRNGREYRLLAQRIPTPRTSLVYKRPANARILTAVFASLVVFVLV